MNVSKEPKAAALVARLLHESHKDFYIEVKQDDQVRFKVLPTSTHFRVLDVIRKKEEKVEIPPGTSVSNALADVLADFNMGYDITVHEIQGQETKRYDSPRRIRKYR